MSIGETNQAIKVSGGIEGGFKLILKSSAKTISQILVLQAFQIYECWSAEEMKIPSRLGLSMEVRGLAFRNDSGWIVVSRSSEQVGGALTVNRRIAMGAELVFARQWPVACENGKVADVAYEQYMRRGAGNQRKQEKQTFQRLEMQLLGVGGIPESQNSAANQQFVHFGIDLTRTMYEIVYLVVQGSRFGCDYQLSVD